MKKIAKFITLIMLIGCNHPENKIYERNQGKHKQFESKPNNNNTNAPLTNFSDDGDYEHRNILKMEIENGVRYVWIEINGIRLRFIFDTGASSICISPAEATVLYRQGTLSRKDILEIEQFQDATGKISEGTKINLRTVKIGNMVLDNVRATVIDNVNAPLLLGQSILERFGKIEIDNENKEIIFK